MQNANSYQNRFIGEAKMDTLRKLFQDYIDYAGELREKTASIKSVLGFREQEIYDSGHKKFDQDVELWVDTFSKTSPSQEALVEALDILLFSAVGYEEKSPFWYLCAVQRHGLKLIALLEDGPRAEMLSRFESCYPRGKRLPIQKDIYKLLSKGTGRRNWRFLPMR